MKKSIFVIFMLCLAQLTACDFSLKALDPRNWEEYGGAVEAAIDGNAQVDETGYKFTEEEILAQVEIAKDFMSLDFQSGAYISTHGYYSSSAGDENTIDYNRYNLLIIYNDKIVGEYQMGRDATGLVEMVGFTVSSPMLENDFTNAIKDYGTIALVFSNGSQYAITENNTILTIGGDGTPTIANPDTLYDTWNLEYNVITDEIFNSEDAYYTVP